MNSFGYWVFGKDMGSVNLETLKSNGVTDLFLNYYAFTVHGESKVLSFIEKARNNGINVHIWMQCFYDGSWINPKTADLSAKISEAKKYANMKNVAGVHLDYLRYPGNAYKTSGGADAITNFVKQVKAAIPKDIILSCAVMPETDDKYYYGQDIEALGKIVDVIIPMQYKGNYNSGTNWLASTTKLFATKSKVWSGLQSYKSDNDTSLLSSNELLNDCKTCLDNGANGVVLFRYGLSPNINFNSLVSNSSSSSISKKIINKNVYSLANVVKEYVEKNKQFPTSVKVDNIEYTNTEIAYILSYIISHLSSDVNIPSTKAPSKFDGGESIKEDIYPSDWQDQAKRIIQYITQNGQLPLYVTTVKSKKKVSVQMFTFAFAKILVWYKNHNNTLPNYCTYDSSVFSSIATSTPISTKSKILNKDIYTLAKSVKASVETNKKLESNFNMGNVTYNNVEIPYIFSYAINNLKSDCTIPNGIKAPSSYTKGNTINEDIYPTDFQDQAKRIVEYVKKNGQIPVYVTTVKSKKQVSVQMFTYAFSKIITWYANNKNTLPNYCTYDTNVFSSSSTTNTTSNSTSSTPDTTSNNCTNPYVSSPHYTTTGCNRLGQCTPYYCGPHSIHQALKKFGITDITEAQLASVAGTTSAGTGHDGLNTAVAWVAKKKGIKLDVEWKRFSELGSTRNARFENAGKIACKSNKALLFHIGYEDSGSSRGSTVYGHYEMCDKFNIKTEYVRALNSLGSRSGNGYLGHLQDRSFSLQEHFINNISQKSVMIITKG